MIGDRLDTDIEFGMNGGIDTLCVLTGKDYDGYEIGETTGLKCALFNIGITTKDKLLASDNKVPSTYYIDSFGDFGTKKD